MNEDRFEPNDVAAFHLDAPVLVWDAHEVEATLPYRLVDREGGVVVACSERFTFPLPAAGVPQERRDAFEALVAHLALVAGISYYKLAAPSRVVVEFGAWTLSSIEAHRTILTRGLGEYCWVNELEPELWPTYEYRSRRSHEAAAVELPLGPLVPVGGGKDSCVSIEALRGAAMAGAAGMAPTLITVNRYPVIQEVIDDAALPDVAVRRVLDQQLRSLNERGARNGHVPATAIVSLAVACAAVLHGHAAVVMSNERSASEGNVVYRGVEINHQWSKSEEAEAILRGLVQSVVPSLEYFSLLRPLSELSIARRFAHTCSRYFDSFSSCNAAFRLDPARRVSRWCGQCPKCQFVYLALATVLTREQLQGIWGSEVLLDSPIEGFRALLGLTEWKPFECVGESGECRVALGILAESPEWSEHPVVVTLLTELDARGLVAGPAEREAIFTTVDVATIPTPYAHVLSGVGA